MLARKERVPARIAKGELEGKMKCRIWRKLHAEEAARFTQAYDLMDKHPGLALNDAFGVLQSGSTVEEFQKKRTKLQKRDAVKQARSKVVAAAVDAFFAGLIASGAEICVVLAERTIVDTLKAVEPLAFQLTRSGRIEKLQVVAVTRRDTWEALQPSLERDPKLVKKPAAALREPDRRPVNDPTVFAGFEGVALDLKLRNGLCLRAPLLTYGPYDLVVGSEKSAIVVPLHGMVSWTPG